ncbi:hypothetical protein RD792_009530 [Penstemon davidsonii]|uniref:BHLH domain-containing protein n=1 Tax=Penstemon davidsonii TaxID=160366 RepID=A0ABR0D0N5_9LAMI|nr:hypothetical protein RD792_009530 [Penstemon davidsonii]
MNDCVPDFREMEDDHQIPTSSGFSRPKKPPRGEDDIMELTWHNGQVVVQRSSKKTSFVGGEAEQAAVKEIQEQEQHQHLFMHEDEMASLLQYNLDESSFDRDLYADFLYSAPPPPPPIAANAPPVPQKSEITPRSQNFMHFSRLPSRLTPQPPVRPAKETTVVESNETPAIRPESRVSHTVADSMVQMNTESGTAEDRKRKSSETDDTEFHSEDIEFEATEAKKQARGSASTRRTRAAEVHNLSERRRRDRINEKMKALQELIPRCNKSDKASMLDEAIEYLKSLQLQVQMMSMGCGMVPMMYPGMQQYMPPMGMGMGMGMDMGMSRSMVPYPSMIPGSTIPNPAAAHMGSRFPVPAFHMQPVRLPDPSRVQSYNQTDPMLNSLVANNPNQPRMQNFVDPYQQFIGLHQAQIPLPQASLIPNHQIIFS